MLDTPHIKVAKPRGAHPDKRLTAVHVRNIKKPGKYADITVLSKDILKVPEDEILTAKVDPVGAPDATVSMFESKKDRVTVLWTEGLKSLPSDYAAK